MVEKKETSRNRTLIGDEVRLTITIGDGQLGGSTMELDGKTIGTPGDVIDTYIGTAAELHGKVLEVKTLVADVNLQGDWTSVTYEFTGVSEGPETLTHKVKQDGNAALYITTFPFAKP